MEQPIQPIVPDGTPLPTPPVGVPPFPITPFAVWTWSTPVIPEFYWNIYSSEQRIKSICKEIGKIESYLNYLTNKVNENIIELHKRIDVLTERVAALEKHVEEEVARLDALIAQLRADLEQEIHAREQGDENLDRRITQEIHDRQDADEVLHGEISQEVQDRIHADDELHEEISHRLLPTDIQAGDEISITRPDPNSNTIVIASTVAHSIAELENTVSGLQAALTAETEERRADDQNLWKAVNERIERGKILAGAGIKVENDPDSSTVTISATGGGTGGATEITGTAPITVTDGEEGEKIVGVSAATEDEAGVISEARVKELAGTVAPSLSAEAPLKLEDGELSLTKDPAGPVTSSDAGLSVREITPDTESETEAGVVSKKTIKDLAASGGVYPGLYPNGGLEDMKSLGGLRVKQGSMYDPIGLSKDGALWLTGGVEEKISIDSEEIDLTIDTGDDPSYDFFQHGVKFLKTLTTSLCDEAAVFVLPEGYFEVKTGGAWEKAEVGCFELFAEADYLKEGNVDNKGYPMGQELYLRLTPRGHVIYTNEAPGDSGKTKITKLRVTYSVYRLFILLEPQNRS